MPFGSSQWMYSSGFYPTEIDQSLMFDGSSYLSRTPSVAGNRKTWTWSGWVKRGSLTGSHILFAGASYELRFISDGGASGITDSLQLSWSGGYGIQTNAVLRDPSAWYHIVLTVDTTQGTASNRAKLYLNGNQLTSSGAAQFTLNLDTDVNNTVVHTIGRRYNNTVLYFNGYLADTYLVDGTALDPTSFGEFKSGVWIPKAYTGSYGTNGFHLTYQDDTVSEGFNTVTWNGNASTQAISGVGFSPDLVWIKAREIAYNHRINDSIRGPNKILYSDLANSEFTDTDQFYSFDNDGFTLGPDAGVNSGASTGKFVGWCWDAGSSTVSNTDGSITSSVRANPAYGFSIVSYTGNGTAGATIGHGLGAAPNTILLKDRSGADSWRVYTSTTGGTKSLYLNLTNAAATDSSIWNNTSPSSTVFTLGNDSGVNTNSNNYIAYCFSEIAGYSKFGSYTGTGASGNAVTTGFKPAFVMIKRTNIGGDNWHMYDGTRSTDSDNVDNRLKADTSEAENSTDVLGEFTDTGFVVNSTSAAKNASGSTYIYMAFADTRDLAFWRDQSGNGNDWQPTNLNYQDTVFDSPTNNYATLNPIWGNSSPPAFSNGNLVAGPSGSGVYNNTISTIAVPASEYWYAEFTATANVPYSGGNNVAIGIVSTTRNTISGSNYIGQAADTYGYLDRGLLKNNNVTSQTVATYATNDVIMVALGNGKLWWGKNGTWQGTGSPNPATATSPAFTGIIGDYFFGLTTYSLPYGGTITANFGQSGFTYTPPDGFLALSTANLPEPSISPANGDSPQDHFNTVLYSGTDGSQSLTVGFQPDFTWVKARSSSQPNVLYDAVRGAGSSKELSSNSSANEGGTSGGFYGDVTSFNSNGFTVDEGSSSAAYVNLSGQTYVGWNWKASNATAVSNTAGSITSQVSANPTAGFSIVSYTGTGVNATVGHGLGVVPEMMIVKSRSGARSWAVYHTSIGNTGAIFLDLTNATSTASFYWNNTTPTSSAFTINIGSTVNTNTENYIAYCFHSVEGYSKFGSYTGNGSADGPFVYTGFRPAFIMWKRTDSSTGGEWTIQDTTRREFNPVNVSLYPSFTNAEATGETFRVQDTLSNGFKIRASAAQCNASGGTYIYMAFAENPFKYANAR